jgi:hypothetical protein
MVDVIRAAASPYKPIIMIPGIDWSRDVSGAITNPVPRENVVYKTHPYNSNSQFQHQFIDTYDAGLPVFIGEFGNVPDAGMSMTDVNALLAIARQRNIGWAAWILDDLTGSTALVTNRSTVNPTSPYGVAVRNEMLTTPALPADNAPPTASIDDTSFQYTGNWQTATGPAKFQGADHYSDIVNSSYQVAFTGTRVTLYAATAPWHGNAVVSIDGGPEATVDFYSPARLDQALVYASPPLTAAAHVLTVRVAGTKNGSSTGTVVTADRADITTPPLLTINDNTIGAGPNQFQYTGAWSYATGNPSKYQGDDHFSNSAGSAARISLTGTRITLYGSKAPWHGIAAISIDGGATTMLDYYAATRQDNLALYTSPPLPVGPHTVTVTVTGARNTAAADTVVTIDRVDVSN